MLRKLDIAKQCELLAEQEIQNYKDSLNYVLQTLRDLKESIKDSREESLENYASVHSFQVQLSSEITSVNEVVVSLGKKVESFFSDQRRENKKFQEDHLSLRESILDLLNKVALNKIEIQRLDTAISLLNDKYHASKNDMDSTFRNMEFKLSKSISKTKEEILAIPSDSIKVKQELERKLDCHKVDVNGITQELMIYKHENMITQKKIENIYTLIERLNNPEVV